jgi:hypothetical protein
LVFANTSTYIFFFFFIHHPSSSYYLSQVLLAVHAPRVSTLAAALDRVTLVAHVWTRTNQAVPVPLVLAHTRDVFVVKIVHLVTLVGIWMTKVATVVLVQAVAWVLLGSKMLVLHVTAALLAKLVVVVWLHVLIAYLVNTLTLQHKGHVKNAQMENFKTVLGKLDAKHAHSDKRVMVQERHRVRHVKVTVTQLIQV